MNIPRMLSVALFGIFVQAETVSLRAGEMACDSLSFEHSLIPSQHQGLWGLDIGDIDGDGDLDFAVVGIYDGGVLSVHRNNGDGSFEEGAHHTVGEDPRCVRLADIDGDLDLDLVVANSLGGSLFVYVNPGNGNFGEPDAEYVFPEGVRPIEFVIADLDGDLAPDIAVSDPYGTVPILWNQGDGSFEFDLSYEINSDGFLYEIVAEDLDGDGRRDLAVLTVPFDPPNVDPTQSEVFVLTNDGNGGFGGPVGYPVPSWPTLVLTAVDADADGDLDLAGVNSPNATPDPNGMWLMFNDGAGGFGEADVYPTGPWPHDVCWGDLDLDGDLDAVVPNHRFAAGEPGAHDVSVFQNLGDGTFAPQQVVQVGVKPAACLAGDMDGDGYLDVVVINFGWGGTASTSVLLNICEPECVAVLYGDIDANGAVNFADVQCEVFAFQGDMSACGGTTGDFDVEPCAGNGVVNFADILAVVHAFQQQPDCPDPVSCP